MAAISLPVPLSPRIRTGMSVRATSVHWCSISSMRLLERTKEVFSSRGVSWNSSKARSSAAPKCPIADSMSLALNGLRIMSAAPMRVAWTTSFKSAEQESMTTGSEGLSSRIFFSIPSEWIPVLFSAVSQSIRTNSGVGFWPTQAISSDGWLKRLNWQRSARMRRM